MTDGGRLRLFDARPRQPRGAAHVQGRSARALWTEPIEKLARASADAHSPAFLPRAILPFSAPSDPARPGSSCMRLGSEAVRLVSEAYGRWTVGGEFAWRVRRARKRSDLPEPSST